MKRANPSESSLSPSELITQRIAELADWRGATLARLRALIHAAVPEIVEEWKWGTPVWSLAGIVCTGETYKRAVKMTFARGASLTDPARLFNASLAGNMRRAIDVHEGEDVDATALAALLRSAVALNVAGKNAARSPETAGKSKGVSAAGKGVGTKLGKKATKPATSKPAKPVAPQGVSKATSKATSKAAPRAKQKAVKKAANKPAAAARKKG